MAGMIADTFPHDLVSQKYNQWARDVSPPSPVPVSARFPSPRGVFTNLCGEPSYLCADVLVRDSES